MRFINRLGPAVCAAAAAVLLTACSGSAASDAGQVGQALGLDLPAVSSISYEDTHGGFHGDGETFAVLTFEGEAAQQMQTLLPAQGWRALPMDGDLEIFAYGGEKNGISYEYEIFAQRDVPTLENGWYWFCDRQDEKNVPFGTDGLLDRVSYNCTLAAYDAHTNTLYYDALDT